MPSLSTRISSRAVFASIAVAAFALVTVSLILTELLGLSPCPLCIFQRMLYMLLALSALVGWVWPRSLRWSGGVALLVAFGGLVTATYQSWLQVFSVGSNACAYQDPNLLEQFVLWAGELAPSLFYAWGDCSSNEWVFLGLSMANWSLAAFLIIMVLLLLAVRRAM